MSSPLDDARAALAASGATDDPEVRVIYAATARAILAGLRADLESLELTLAAHEREMARVAGGRT